jgi:transcriptional regulator with XRE-family HTH domain
MNVMGKPLTDQLRQAIAQSGMTRYEIAKRTGVSEATLSRFYTGTRPGLSMQALDALGECLGLKIVSTRKTSKRKSR